MTDYELEKNCNCPMQCESISYFYAYVSSPFDPEELCSKQQNGLMEEFYKNKYPPQFVRNLKKFKYQKQNVTSNALEICRKNVQYRAERF